MARAVLPGPNFANYLTIGEAAEFLGVSAATLRNWDRSGKLKPRRHPQNGYRIYLHEDLEAVLHSAELPTASERSFASLVDWSSIREDEHFVQFYETDEYLIDCACGFLSVALRDERSAAVIAVTPEHRIQLERALVANGIDTNAAEASGRYVVLDAAEALSNFMVGGRPDPQRFQELAGPLMARLAAFGGRVHAFGEIVALMWRDGNREGAIALEQLWHELAQQHRFAILCAYPLSLFHESESAGFDGVCKCHTRVLPAESYSALTTEDERLRSISSLQQKAQSLAGEIAHRREIEQFLRQREHELSETLGHAGSESELTTVRRLLQLYDKPINARSES